MDEAVLRVKIEGDGTQPASAGGAPLPRVPSAGTPAGVAPPMGGQPKAPPAAGAPPKEFDPYEAARKRRSPAQQDAVDAAYKEMYGVEPKKKADDAFGQLLHLATRMRGVLGGVFGSLVGAGLDAAAAFIEMRDNAKAPPGIQPTVPSMPSEPLMPQVMIPEGPSPAITPTVSAALQQMAKPKPPPAASEPITPFEVEKPFIGPALPPAPKGIPLYEPPPDVFEVEKPPEPASVARKQSDWLLGAPRRVAGDMSSILGPARGNVEPPTIPPAGSEVPIALANVEIPFDWKNPLFSGQRGVPNAPPDVSHLLQPPFARSANEETGAFRYGGQAKPVGMPDPYASPAEQAAFHVEQPQPQMGIAFQSDKAFAPPADNGAGLGAAAASALPLVGAVVGAVYAVTKAVGAVANAVISGAGETLAGLVGPNSDPAHAIDGFGQTIKKTGDSFFLLAPGLSVLQSAVGETVSAFGKLLEAIDGSVAKYAEVNPLVAQATAMAELRQVLGDIRRGNEVGPELARYVNARADVQQKYEDIKVRILEQILPAVTGGLKTVDKLLPLVDMMASLLKYTNPILMILEVLNELIPDNTPAVEDPTDIVLHSLLNQPGPGIPGRPTIQTPQV